MAHVGAVHGLGCIINLIRNLRMIEQAGDLWPSTSLLLTWSDRPLTVIRTRVPGKQESEAQFRLQAAIYTYLVP